MLTNLSQAEAVTVDRICHSKGIAVVRADIRGVFASVFCDFGKEFLVNDVDGVCCNVTSLFIGLRCIFLSARCRSAVPRAAVTKGVYLLAASVKQ